MGCLKGRRHSADLVAAPFSLSATEDVGDPDARLLLQLGPPQGLAARFRGFGAEVKRDSRTETAGTFSLLGLVGSSQNAVQPVAPRNSSPSFSAAGSGTAGSAMCTVRRSGGSARRRRASSGGIAQVASEGTSATPNPAAT